ncbi:hypothetical protein PQU92_13340 [Asticcacaulis sp. BYS171W]|uniref:Uncharacterized protein n=1 Tax=Asticcacaulis aquaticus TaxID=2984212 RepID=A0ABT5HW35_9CAUL|nr:hypothetical protein [Asticcacaulis aquaticus]MDC7684269.1 hypothetical protein [Asticcacaulis aquaticus]
MSTHLKWASAIVIGGALAVTVAVGFAQAQDAKSNSTASRATTLKPTAVSAAKINPVLLRKPEAPARVDWSAAVMQSRAAPISTLNLKAARDPKAPTIQPLAARLPRQELDKTRLPMLMPKTGGLIKIDKAKVVSFGDAYSLNLPQDKGMQLTLMGNRSMIKADRGMISAKARAKVNGVAETVRITKLEDGWTASFRRYGVLYTVDLLCEDLQSAACATDGYLRAAIADISEVTLGAEAMKEAQAAGVK